MIDNIVYVVGGGNITGNLATVEAYSATANTWKTKPSMPIYRTAPIAGVINRVLYVVGSTYNSAGQAGIMAYFP